MQFPVLTLMILVFIAWLHYRIKITKTLSYKESNHFWQREQEANLTRRKDIKDLKYIKIPLNQLPMADFNDDTINSYRDTIKNLSDKTIVNLAGRSNTDLKFQYGASNLQLLMEYDNNYTLLVSILHKWGERLYNNSLLKEAASVLELAVSCSTDATNTYRLLARIYMEQNTPEKIETLINVISDSSLERKDLILHEVIKISSSS